MARWYMVEVWYEDLPEVKDKVLDRCIGRLFEYLEASFGCSEQMCNSSNGQLRARMQCETNSKS